MREGVTEGEEKERRKGRRMGGVRERERRGGSVGKGMREGGRKGKGEDEGHTCTYVRIYVHVLPCCLYSSAICLFLSENGYS